MLALKSPKTSTRGFTLVELLVVLSMVAILATLAAPQFGRTIARQQLSTVASDMMTATLQARSEALKTNRRAFVQPLSGTDWSSGWRVFVDVSSDASYSSGSDTQVVSREAIPSGVVVKSGTGETNITSIGFEPTGFLANAAGSFAGRVVFGATNYSDEATKHVIVARTGRVYICTKKVSSDCP